jgi:hypothetical protein
LDEATVENISSSRAKQRVIALRRENRQSKTQKPRSSTLIDPIEERKLTFQDLKQKISYEKK